MQLGFYEARNKFLNENSCNHYYIKIRQKDQTLSTIVLVIIFKAFVLHVLFEYNALPIGEVYVTTQVLEDSSGMVFVLESARWFIMILVN